MISMALVERLMHWLVYKRSLKGTLFSMIEILMAIFILLCIISLAQWIWFYDEGIIILPFQTPSNQGYNGQSLSDLLTHELIRIKEINQAQDVSYNLQLENYIIPNFTRQDSTINYRISQVGMLGQGSISLSLGDILLTLKSILPRASRVTTLSTSLQSYGNKIVLVATLDEPEGLHTWQIISNSNCSKEEIPQLVQELAYQVAYSVYIHKPRSISTWQAFADITQGQEAFLNYRSTGNTSQLEIAKNMAIKAEKWGKGYNVSYKLLTVVAFEYAYKGEYDEAIKAYDEIISLDPNDTYAWNDKGATLYHLGKYDEAIKAYDEAIRLDPNDTYAWYAWYNKGTALGDLGKYDEAIKAYDEVIRLNPNNASAWNDKGATLYHLGKYDEAIKAYDEAIRLDPKDIGALFSKSTALGDLGKYDEAIKAYDEVIRLEPNNGPAWSNKGLALKELNRTFESEIAFANAREAFAKGCCVEKVL